MKYPKYKREEKKNAKLSEKQVLEIKKLREDGNSLRKIGKMYNVSDTCIFRITQTKEQQKQYREYLKIYQRNIEKNKLKEIQKDSYERKKQKMQEKLFNWYKKERKNYYEKNKERSMLRSKEYRKKNLEEYRKYQREYQKKRRLLKLTKKHPLGSA